MAQVTALDDPDPKVRSEILFSLGLHRVNDPRVRPKVIGAFRDHAATALQRVRLTS